MALGKFLFPTIYQTGSICLGPTVTKIHVITYYTGTIIFHVTANGGTNWESITLVSGVRKEHTFTTSGTDVRFRAIGVKARISTQFNSADGYNNPGLKIEISEHV